MQSFIKATLILTIFHGGSFASPISGPVLEHRGTDFWYPTPLTPTNGPITAIGANGGYNYGGDGANGGYIGIANYAGGGSSIYANGANGGQNAYGNGANGGSISVGRRGAGFLFPIYNSYTPPNGPISAYGANGGYNQYGNGRISINRREDSISLQKLQGSPDIRNLLWGWYGNQPLLYSGSGKLSSTTYGNKPPTAQPIFVTGHNGGVSYNGNGANGGTISVPSGTTTTEPDTSTGLAGTGSPTKVTITANGQNGVTMNGEGSNGGTISVTSESVSQ
ncbi:hypothetical protein JR316_0010819 [Psilocybe cubensis]|uniref:Uncharacterized protein n=2 Tax=Psilocybe cubensis TaxID=181762 RepID=A0ACB8GML9_PSICU|nr:hypothetical protein JR316_0010819 [Psilocybe cubensis]KAH9476903.1 hypothetical protein JR316_0010819 [Psilocybe cubensis]